MVEKYIPKQRDLVFLDLNPTKGHEQKGIRPALIISNDIFNEKTHTALACPITTNTTTYPTHYELQKTKKIKGAVLCEHIRSIDYNARNLKYIENCNKEEFREILELIKSFVE